MSLLNVAHENWPRYPGGKKNCAARRKFILDEHPLLSAILLLPFFFLSFFSSCDAVLVVSVRISDFERRRNESWRNHRSIPEIRRRLFDTVLNDTGTSTESATVKPYLVPTQRERAIQAHLLAMNKRTRTVNNIHLHSLITSIARGMAGKSMKVSSIQRRDDC